jgi:ABC-2 type transport system permease protein
MSQFGTILKFELKAYIKNKTFVGITLLLVLLIAAVMCFPRITALFEDGDTAVSPASRPVMLIKADTASQADLVGQTFTEAFGDYSVQITDLDVTDIQNQITSGQAECAFVMTGPTEYVYYVNNLSMYDTNEAVAAEVLRQVYQMNVMMGSGMTAEEVGAVMSIQITSRVEPLGKDQMENFFYTYIMIFALYMVILLYGQMVATNVATEKSSRAMEVLITSAKPTSMMFGKVIASCIAGLVQLLAVFGSALVFYNLNKSYWEDEQTIQSIFNIPPELLGYMLVFFLLGFLIFAFLYGAIASTVSRLEDINTAVQPVTFLFLIGFMVVIFSMTSANVDSILMKICSFVPFTSPMAMFTRIAMSTVAWYEIAASIAILAGSTVAVGFVAAKIYRTGVLLYGTTPKIGTVLKMIWKA